MRAHGDGHHVRPLLVPENHDGNLSPGQILLVTNVLARGEKQIVPSLFSFSEQLTVLEFKPANLASKRYLMPNETTCDWIGRAVVKQKFSSVSRGLFQTLRGETQYGFNFLFRHIKHLGDLLHGQACLKVFKNCLHRHTGAFENPGTANLAGNALDRGAMGPIKFWHGQPPFHPNAHAMFGKRSKLRRISRDVVIQPVRGHSRYQRIALWRIAVPYAVNMDLSRI